MLALQLFLCQYPRGAQRLDSGSALDLKIRIPVTKVSLLNHMSKLAAQGIIHHWGSVVDFTRIEWPISLDGAATGPKLIDEPLSTPIYPSQLRPTVRRPDFDFSFGAPVNGNPAAVSHDGPARKADGKLSCGPDHFWHEQSSCADPKCNCCSNTCSMGLKTLNWSHRDMDNCCRDCNLFSCATDQDEAQTVASASSLVVLEPTVDSLKIYTFLV